MNRQLQIIDQREVLGKDFKIYGTKEEPLFLAKDVANWIEHRNITHMMKTVDEDEKLTYTISNSGQGREMWFLTEDGLYEVLMQSRKPIAKAFKKEVKQILKQIRMTGGYIPVKEEETAEQLMARALMVAQKTLEQKDLILKQQQEKLQEQKPKVEYYEEVLDSSRLITVGQIANDLGITPQKLNQYLKLKGIQNNQYKTGWKISAKYNYLIEEGYADYHIYTKHSVQAQQLKWTEKGRKFIIDMFNEDKRIFENRK
ncbi:TPA: phage antirepressor KilAC domain-containing protein [Clostridium perfringens]|nr:phage antirepressor KilAC domain-containing protein [Clostridium perfringens]